MEKRQRRAMISSIDIQRSTFGPSYDDSFCSPYYLLFYMAKVTMQTKVGEIYVRLSDLPAKSKTFVGLLRGINFGAHSCPLEDVRYIGAI